MCVCVFYCNSKICTMMYCTHICSKRTPQLNTTILEDTRSILQDHVAEPEIKTEVQVSSNAWATLIQGFCSEMSQNT